MSVKIQTRHVGSIAILDITGHIIFGKGSCHLEDVVRNLVLAGQPKIIINLKGVEHIDPACVRELISAHIVASHSDGQIRLIGPQRKVSDQLQMRQLRIPEIYVDEETALRYF